MLELRELLKAARNNGLSLEQILQTQPRSAESRIRGIWRQLRQEEIDAADPVAKALRNIHPDHHEQARKLYAKAQRQLQQLDRGRELKVWLDNSRSIKGKVIRAEVDRIKYAGQRIKVIYKITLLCGITANKVEKTVHIDTLPVYC